MHIFPWKKLLVIVFKCGKVFNIWEVSNSLILKIQYDFSLSQFCRTSVFVNLKSTGFCFEDSSCSNCDCLLYHIIWKHSFSIFPSRTCDCVSYSFYSFDFPVWYSISSYFNKGGKNSSNFTLKLQEYSTQITIHTQRAILSIDSYSVGISLVDITTKLPSLYLHTS